MKTWSSVLIPVVLMACTGPTPGGGSSSSGGTDGGSGVLDAGVIAADRFCEEFANAVCSTVQTCGCGTTAHADCLSSTLQNCGREDGILGSRVRAAIAAGTMTYDGARAAAVVASIRQAVTSCSNIFDTLEWSIVDFYTVDGVVNGTRGAGDSCRAISEGSTGDCRNGFCVGSNDAGMGSCIAAAYLGDDCNATHYCVSTEAVDDPESDKGFLPCVGDGGMQGNFPVGRCSARRPNGNPCDRHYDCESLRCSNTGVCVPKAANTSSCGENADCESGYCNYTTSMCEAGELASGAACDQGVQCASNACVNDACGAQVCQF